MRGGILLSGERRDKAQPYVEALRLAGFDTERVQVLSPEDGEQDPEALRALAANAAGLLLCGGPDVAPERYGRARRDDANLRVIEELDAVEFELLAGADAGSTPVLGVCRGLQILNVYLGGTLHQDLPTELDEPLQHRVSEPLSALAHEIEVFDEELPIGALYGRQPVAVNSRHHQAVERLADELRPVARSSDGVLEVVQSEPRSWWRWAVQWHPENLIEHEVHRRLWSAFVQRVEARHGALAVEPS